jgi:hypothetical protein
MLSDLNARLTEALKDGVNRATETLKKEIDRLTPEDTGRLLANNKTKQAVSQGDKVTGAVVNDTEYAGYVEYGVGRKFNYHKPKGSVAYRGIGARMFTRAFDANRKKLSEIIAESVKKAVRAPKR